jgi:hypothetical protein
MNQNPIKEGPLPSVATANVAEETAHNRTVYASPPYGGSGFRSARSFASLHPHFVDPVNATHLLIRAAKMS